MHAKQDLFFVMFYTCSVLEYSSLQFAPNTGKVAQKERSLYPKLCFLYEFTDKCISEKNTKKYNPTPRTRGIRIIPPPSPSPRVSLCPSRPPSPRLFNPTPHTRGISLSLDYYF